MKHISTYLQRTRFNLEVNRFVLDIRRLQEQKKISDEDAEQIITLISPVCSPNKEDHVDA